MAGLQDTWLDYRIRGWTTNSQPNNRNNRIRGWTTSGTTSLGKGSKIYIRLEKTSEENQVLSPDWEIGTAEIVEEEPDLPRTEMKETGLPSIPEDLSGKEKKDLEALLKEFQYVFACKGMKFGNTPVIEHEIHMRGPLIRQSSRRQTPEVR